MGRIIEERPSFTERLSNVMGIAEKGVGIAKGIQDISQAPQRFKMEQEKAKAQMEVFALQKQESDMALKQKKMEITETGENMVMGELFQAIKLYGATEDNTKRKAAFQSYFSDPQRRKKMLTAANEAAGWNITEQDLDNLIKNKLDVAAPEMSTLFSRGAALDKLVSQPDSVFNAKEAANILETFSNDAVRVGGLLGSQADATLQKQVDKHRKAIDDKNARVMRYAELDESKATRKMAVDLKNEQRDEDQLNRLLQDAEKQIKPQRESLQTLETVKGQIEAASEGVPMAIDLAQRFVGMMANKGAFSEEDRRAVRGSQDLLSNATRTIETLTTGKATPGDIATLKAVLDKMEGNINTAINKTVVDFSKTRGNVYKGITPERILNQFGVPTTQEGLRTQPSTTQQPQQKKSMQDILKRRAQERQAK